MYASLFFFISFTFYVFQQIICLPIYKANVRPKSPTLYSLQGKRIESSSFGDKTGLLPINYRERSVPTEVSRFDYPWVVPTEVKTLRPEQSRNRFLYSPLKSFYINGLGHNMATMNGEVWAALILNLTYTHRIARYMVHSVPLNKAMEKTNENSRPFLHAGAVEQLFGWGVGEIPREHLQNSICSSSVLNITEEQCAICNNLTLKDRKKEDEKDIHQKRSISTIEIQVNEVVELPYDLTYGIASEPNTSQLQKMTLFMEKHSNPDTVFSLPSVVCDKNPYFGRFSKQQRAFFFHKYWESHGYGSPVVHWANFENETFHDYKVRVINTPNIEPVGRRPVLTRLSADRINIAVHARRGDFFKTKRPMLSISIIAHLIRQIVHYVIIPSGGTFSRMGITVMIYSEGTSLQQQPNRGVQNHDVSKLDKHFVDVDGQLLSPGMIREMILNNKSDIIPDIFEAGLEVSLRISENTILSIHEMIAADIFIGSESSLSQNIVGSLSRAAFLLLSRYTGEEYLRFIKFDGRTGEVRKSRIQVMKQLWERFQLHHQ